jgi:hypothetical protein
MASVGRLRGLVTGNMPVHRAMSPRSRMAPQLLEDLVIMKNQDADLGKLEDGDLLVGRPHGPRDDEDVIEIGDEDLIDEEDLLADEGDLDFEPENDY